MRLEKFRVPAYVTPDDEGWAGKIVVLALPQDRFLEILVAELDAIEAQIAALTSRT